LVDFGIVSSSMPFDSYFMKIYAQVEKFSWPSGRPWHMDRDSSSGHNFVQ